MKVAAIVAAAIGMLAVAAASAHHSFAMFDDSKQIELVGTLKKLQWTNPHIFVQLMVPDAAGVPVEWSIEGSSPNLIKRWNPQGAEIFRKLSSGVKLTVQANPLRNGAPGGSLVSVKLPDGRVLSEGPGRVEATASKGE